MAKKTPTVVDPRSRIVKIDKVRAEDITPHPGNWRDHPEAQADAIAGVMREVGDVGVLLAWHSERNGGRLTLIDGHLRRGIAPGHEYHVAITDLTDAEADYVLATHDPLANMAIPDAAALDALLSSINTSETGVQKMLADLAKETGVGFTQEENDAEPQVDKAEELNKKWQVQAGDLWHIGEHRLLCADSTKNENVMLAMSGELADLGFTSPPYNLGKAVNLRNGARRGADSAYNDNEDVNDGWAQMMESFIDNALNVCKECAVNVQLVSGNKIDLLSLFGKYANHTVDIAVWVKPNPQPAMAAGVMSSAFEFVWVISKNSNPTRKLASSSFARGSFSNVFSHATASGHDATVHGAIFPIGVATHFIKSLSKDNSIIFEPFAGSGTTLVACENIRRKCRAIEISPAYCAVILQRMNDAFPGIDIRKI